MKKVYGLEAWSIAIYAHVLQELGKALENTRYLTSKLDVCRTTEGGVQ